MEDRVRRYIREHELLLPPARAVVGLSGGVDSVVLFNLLLALGVELHVVHINYQLRDSSDADERFVRDLCESRDVPVTVCRRPIDPERVRGRMSVQERARNLRYEAFEQAALEHGFSRVAVGHQMDDQIETVLLQLVRGTGLRGLAGMPVRRPINRGSSVEVVRPLLFARRSPLEAHARENGWEWRVDVSNRSTEYLRPALRHDVLPRLEERVGAGGMENIARAAALVREYLEKEMEPRLAEELERVVDVRVDGTIRLALEPLEDASKIWRQELILETIRRFAPELPIAEVTAEEIADLVEAQVGRRTTYAGYTIWRERGCLLIVPEAVKIEEIDDRLEPGETLHLPGVGRLSLERLARVPDRPADSESNTACIDAEQVELPLHVRRWHDGDRLRPLGMEGHKNVSDILTDAKVPPHRRDRIHVVVSGECIIWVVGFRLAHDVRITSATNRALRLSLQSEFVQTQPI